MNSYLDIIVSSSVQHYITKETMIGALYLKVSESFWHPWFWLPRGLHWEDLVDTEQIKYPQVHDVCVYPLFFAVLLLLLKAFILDPLILYPLACLSGISLKRPRSPIYCPSLEVVFAKYGCSPPKNVLSSVLDSIEMSKRQAERWLRRRRAFAQPSVYGKFIDCGFNLLCHFSLTVLGVGVMYSKPWVWDISNAYKDYPHHNIDEGTWWYYILGLSYFWASAFLQIQSPGRSSFDKIQMMLHHLFTILLMMFSWTCNFTRSGSLVLLVHEVADVPLLFAKMLTYAKVKKLTDSVFVVFVLSWAVTRCYLYPFWILKETIIQTDENFQTPAFMLQYTLSIGLLVINIVWTFLISRVVVRKVTAGGELKDVRSEAEDVTTDPNTCTKDKDE